MTKKIAGDERKPAGPAVLGYISSAMTLTAAFVRVRGERDRIYVHRSDGTEVSWVFPTYGSELPHDLVHLVVEAAFDVRRGFWGRIHAGVDPARINAEANRIGTKAKYRGFGEDVRELILAEALANAGWWDATRSDTGLRNAIEAACASAELATPDTVVLPQIARARRVLDALRERWRSFGEKGTIELAFDPVDPAREFDAIAERVLED